MTSARRRPRVPAGTSGSSEQQVASAAASAPAAPRAPAATSATGVLTPRSVLVPALVLLVVLVAWTVASFLWRSTTPTVGADAPAGQFSAERAAASVAQVVDRPRPLGSADNAAARQELITTLQSLGFEVREESGIGTGVMRAGMVHNIVATRPGTDPTGTLVLATHHDSVPATPGAADPGVGLATIVETVRALGENAHRNDLVVLLVDGEEYGLLGADAFLRDSAAQLHQPVVVFNHEARGSSGIPIVTRTAGPIAPILEAAPRPEVESAIDALFRFLPNATDFSRYREGGWWGADMAMIGDGWTYHTALDDAAHLDHDSLQHYGEMTLAMSRDALDRDLGALGGGAGDGGAGDAGATVTTTLPWGLLHLPTWTIPFLAALGLAGAIGAALVRRRSGELTWPRLALGTLAAVVVKALASVAAIATWQVVAVLAPGIRSAALGEPMHGGWFFLAEALVGVGVLAACYLILVPLLGRSAVHVGATLAAALVILAGCALSVPLMSYLVLTVAVGGLGAMLASLLRSPVASLVVRAILLAPMGWLLGVQISSLMDFGISSSVGGVVATLALVVAAAAGMVLPAAAPVYASTVVETAAPAARSRRARGQGRRRLRGLAVGVATLVVFLGAGAGAAAAGVARNDGAMPVQYPIRATVDATEGTVACEAYDFTWDVTALGSWCQDLEGASGPVSPEQIAHLPAPAAQVEVDGERLVATVTSEREATILYLTVPGAQLSQVSVDGVALREDEGDVERDRVAVYGVPAGQTVRIEAQISGEAAFAVVADVSFNVSQAPNWVAPPSDVLVMDPVLAVEATVPITTP